MALPRNDVLIRRIGYNSLYRYFEEWFFLWNDADSAGLANLNWDETNPKNVNFMSFKQAFHSVHHCGICKMIKDLQRQLIKHDLRMNFKLREIVKCDEDTQKGRGILRNKDRCVKNAVYNNI
jgi:hypothetical protein